MTGLVSLTGCAHGTPLRIMADAKDAQKVIGGESIYVIARMIMRTYNYKLQTHRLPEWEDKEK